MLPYSVIIPVHNQMKYLHDCVISVMQNTPKPFGLVLVDDGSADQTRKFCESLDKGKVVDKLIRNDAPQGFTTAVNQGIAALEAEWYILLNSDTIIGTKNWAQKITNASSECCSGEGWAGRHKDADIMGCVSNFAGLQSVPADGQLLPGFTPALMGKLLDLIGSPTGKEVRFVHGFCYAIHRSVVERIGLLDAVEFPHYGSEDDYTFRAYEAGFRMAVAENVFVYHAQNKSYGEHRKEIIKESVPKFFERHGGSKLMQELAKASHLALGGLRHEVFRFLQDFMPKGLVKGVVCKAN